MSAAAAVLFAGSVVVAVVALGSWRSSATSGRAGDVLARIERRRAAGLGRFNSWQLRGVALGLLRLHDILVRLHAAGQWEDAHAAGTA